MRKLSYLFIICLLLPTIGFSQQNNDELIKRLSNQGELRMEVQNDTIPIEIWNDVILLKLKVNGKEGYFMWDNGFSFSAVDKPFATQLNLSNIENLNSIQADDAIKAQVDLDIKLAQAIEIGKAKVENSPVLITELNAIFGKHYKINGVLGATTIKKFNWNFNFDKNYVVISKKPFEGKGININFDLNPYNKMLTAFGVNGQMAQAEIDFGDNSDDVAITMQAAPLFSESKKNLVIGQTTSSVSGLAKIDTSFVVKKFQYVISDTITTVPHKFRMKVSKSERGVRIGNRFFRNYNCIVNFSTGKIILSERKTGIDAMPEKSFGFTLLKLDDKLRIIIKSNNPNTHKYPNLKLQDEIIEVNGKKADDFNGNVALKEFQINALKSGERLILKRADGKIFTLKPEKNFYK